MTEEAITGPGVCAGMGTANSMAITCEVLGMALPGTTPVPANSPAMWDAVARAGKRIVEMVGEGLRPRQVLTAAAFRNAATVMLALAGSINTIKHLQAVARRRARQARRHPCGAVRRDRLAWRLRAVRQAAVRRRNAERHHPITG
jgi:dihydroxy-acid dehydratase